MKRWVVVAVAAGVTLVLFAIAFTLGAGYFQVRRLGVHRERLQRLLPLRPTVDQVTRGLQEEGSPLLAAPETPAEREAAIVRHGGNAVPEVREKARRWPHLRVHRAGDMVYVLYYDARGTLVDFTLVSRGG